MTNSRQKKAGPQGKTAERARYIELTRQGLNNSKICRILGIYRKTGSKWRNGYTMKDPKTGVIRRYEPIVDVSELRTISSRFLSEAERIAIADLHSRHHSVRRIASILGRAPSTISRELRRNSGPSGAYRPVQAHKRACGRRTRVRPGKIASNPELRHHIERLLERRWSPGQIAQHLRTEFPNDAGMHVVHETIYRDLYDWRGGALAREYCRLLRTRRTRRKPSRMIARRRSRFGGDVLMINDRPYLPTDRSTPGHWEGDLIMGRHNRSAISTLVERNTRFLVLVPINAATRSESLRNMLAPRMLQLPAQLRRSLTWDQGWEMAKHMEIATATGMQIYFCDPHSPWQRGTNENTGLLRDYFPKGSDLNLHAAKTLDAVANELNSRPRQVLGWDTPASRFAKLLSEPISP